MNISRRALLTVPLAALLLASCSREKQDERIVLGFSQIGAESEWRTANTESIKTAAATMNIDLRFADAQQKQENQIKALRTFIAQKVDVIMFAPVVTRIVTYSLPVPRFAQSYMLAVLQHPFMQDWIAAAQEEDWVIEQFELPATT